MARLPIGKNTLYDVPKVVAAALGKNRDEVKEYTGHSFRRSSARLAADNGASTMALRRHFGWGNEKTPQRYVDDSFDNNMSMAKLIPVQAAATPAPAAPQSHTPTHVAVATVPVASTPHHFTFDFNVNVNVCNKY